MFTTPGVVRIAISDRELGASAKTPSPLKSHSYLTIVCGPSGSTEVPPSNATRCPSSGTLNGWPATRSRAAKVNRAVGGALTRTVCCTTVDTPSESVTRSVTVLFPAVW